MRRVSTAGLVFAVLALLTGACDRTERDWEQAQRAGTSRSYARFLRLHPAGQHSESARAWLDAAAYDLAAKSGSIEAFREFLKQNPSSRHVARAQTEIDRIEFQPVREANQFRRYREYVVAHLDGPFAAEARAWIDSFYSRRAPCCRSMRTVYIADRITSDGDGGNDRIVWFAQRFLDAAGLETVNDPGADATLEVRATAHVVTAAYHLGPQGPAQTFATGASISGTIALRSAGRALFGAAFAGRRQPPEHVSVNSASPFETPTGPDSAPLEMAVLGSSYLRDLAVMTRRLFGVQPLVDLATDSPDIDVGLAVNAALKGDRDAADGFIAALKSGTIGRRRLAIYALVDLGDRRAVGPLIDLLADEKAGLREDARLALERLTGQRQFGDDAARWRAWFAAGRPAKSP